MKKALKIIGIVLFSALFIVYLSYLVFKQPINSDGAAMLLEARDVLDGNILLSNWHLTGVSFITTDLPWFAVSVAIFGVSVKAYHLACILMYLFMVASSLPLVFYKVENKFTAFMILLGIGLIPTTYALSHAFVHTAVFALSFLAMYFILSYENEQKISKLVLLGIISALACCGDHSALALITLPALVLMVAKKINLKSGLVSVISSIAGLGLEKLYCLVGGADWNTYYTTTFASLKAIPQNIRLYVEYFLKLINASFFGKELFSVKTAVFGLKIVLACVAVFLLIKAIFKLFSDEKTDKATQMFAISFGAITLLLWLTTLTTDITTGRYIAFMPLMLSIVLARGELIKNDVFKIVCIAVCAVLFASSLMPHGSAFSKNNSFSRLAEYLEKEKLTYGYAAFWDSSVINAYSDNKVKVRAIKYENEKLAPRVWFCKNSWYNREDGFIIVREKGNKKEEENYRFNGIYTERVDGGCQYDITKENVISYLGNPKEIKTFENYSILIYEKIPLYKEELWKN